MKAVVAIDSMKGSLSSLAAGQAAKEGILRAYPEAEVSVFPVADGGEGTVDALVFGLNGNKRSVRATDPLGREILCQYGVIGDRCALLEMSCAAGITLISEEEKNPLVTTTYGVGQVIRDAMEKGCRHFVIGIGGSATNDGGIGMLQALGFGMLNDKGSPVSSGARGAAELCRITTDGVSPILKECRFEIACDVNNPLCGKTGCSAIYGPQKGADPQTVKEMDAALSHYADVVKKTFPKADPNFPGAGAAGGIGFAFQTFLGAELICGIDLILRTVGLEESVEKSDLVVTGEGRLDAQTAMGKAPSGIAKIAKKHNKTVIAFAGCVTPDARLLNECGIDAFFPIVPKACSLEEAMNEKNARENLRNTAEQAFRLLRAAESIR
ncbi:MAG: glycerate kinase [Clostridia bacterium]|nr:glycerate kinase [Clostridia bacterium]